ncbi:kinase-like domain-containing protein [Hyaloraphidium curvatum]|nr:kinase-like domain-containing protein [Hyaloraphidium curvatum]
MGKDAVGTIYHTHHPPTNQDFCMRIIPKAGLQGNRTGASADTVRRTSELWGGLDHPQVMKMFDWWETDTEFVQIFTLVSGGRLSDRIRKHGRFPERDAAVVMATICNAAAYLHSVGVVHRDMRAESVLYRDADPESIMYLGYLDLAVEVPEGGSVTGAVGTVANAAPEILRRRPYSFPADCWSLGILAYQLLSGAHPFVSGRGTVGDAIDCILGTEPDTDGTDWAMVSPEGKEFVRRLLDKEPGTRMTAAEALGNEWLQLYTPRTYLEWLRSITERAAHGHEEEAGLHERVGTNGI